MDTKVTLVYFSPTNGSRRYGEMVARKLADTFDEVNLTSLSERKRTHSFSSDEIVIFSFPVYKGRLPEMTPPLLDCLKGDATPAVILVTYGVRAYDDALLEEKEELEKRGFSPLSAAAFISKHTYSDQLGAARPDPEDEKRICEFAEKVKLAMKSGMKGTLNVPGKKPYKEIAKGKAFRISVDEKCTGCMKCAFLCPTGAIDRNDPAKTDEDLCISCFACIEACPTAARKCEDESFFAIREHLEKALLNMRKEAEFFYLS